MDIFLQTLVHADPLFGTALNAVVFPPGAVVAFTVPVKFDFVHTALSNASLYDNKFSTRLAPSNLASPLFACRITPSKSVTLAVVARVKVGFPVPAWRSRVLLRSAAKAGASFVTVSFVVAPRDTESVALVIFVNCVSVKTFFQIFTFLIVPNA